jgi:hypothetical protein
VGEVLGRGLAHERDVAGQKSHGVLGPRGPQMHLAFGHDVNGECRPPAEAQAPLAMRGGAGERSAAGAGALQQVRQHVHRQGR